METLHAATGGFWAVVKANVAEGGGAREDALNEWWSEEHVPEYVARDGFRHGWRSRAHDAGGQIGESFHRYHAVYEVETVDAFNRALEMGSKSHPGRPWGPWQEFVDDYLVDWERTYYRVVHRQDPGDNAGDFWTTVRADLSFEGPEHEREFNAWYSEKHMPEICAYPGIHRAWRLEVEPDDNDLGPSRHRYWGVYQVDRPEDFAAARDDRAKQGIEPWDGIWLPHLTNFEITFHELIYETSK